MATKSDRCRLLECAQKMLLLMIQVLTFYINLKVESRAESYYILPTLNDICPVRHCFTLSELAASIVHSSWDVNTAMTLTFLPGNHNLSQELSIANISAIVMITHSASAYCTVSCTEPINFHNVSHVYVRGLKFISCRGNRVMKVSQFTLEESEFVNSTETALEVIDTTAIIVNSSFIGNSFGQYRDEKLRVGSAIIISASNVSITDSRFERNSADAGGAIFGEANCEITILRGVFIYNVALRGGGGFMYTRSGCSIVIIDVQYAQHNIAYIGNGAIFAFHQSVTVTIIGGQYINNTADQVHTNAAGVISVDASNISITNSVFINNSGGVVYGNDVIIQVTNSHFEMNSGLEGVMSLSNATATLSDNQFINNDACSGGAFGVDTTTLNIYQCSFIGNTATVGAVALISQSTLNAHNITVSNNVGNEGIMTIDKSDVTFTHEATFTGNSGSLLAHDSNITFKGVTTFASGEQPVSVDLCIYRSFGVPSHSKLQLDGKEGGSITAFQSTVVLNGYSHFVNNRAPFGGAIYASYSEIRVHGKAVIENNTATENGGGVCLLGSKLICQNNSVLQLERNHAYIKGGGMHLLYSSIEIHFSGIKNIANVAVQFINNKARLGGGLHMDSSRLHIVRDEIVTNFDDNAYYFITIEANTADYGGGIFISDSTNPTCASTSYKSFSPSSQCVLLTTNFGTTNVDYAIRNIKFTKNYAISDGHEIYGGLFDRCTVSQTDVLSVTIFEQTSHGIKDQPFGLLYLKIISNLNDLKSNISSDAMKLCDCTNPVFNCTNQVVDHEVRKGELFTISVVAVNQVNMPIATYVRSYLTSEDSGLGEGQLIQKTRDECTNLSFTIFSPLEVEQVIMYADGPCGDAPLSQKVINVSFSPCKCPLGFQRVLTEMTSCNCECDTFLKPYVTQCDPNTETLVRQGRFIINTRSVNNSLTYFVYPNCPLGYCKPPNEVVQVSLVTENGTDAQCVNGRTGILCGQCGPGFTLSFGSTNCLKCPKYWPGILAAIIIGTLLAGVALVVFLLILNLTVAAGTLNGIIFYANIVGADSTNFFRFQTPNYITVIIAWLNMEIGFDVCLYEGMDTYYKQLIHTAFPLYVVFIVVMCIFISERSSRFARLLGRKNPVATLATVILLSNGNIAKLLRSAVDAFSFAVLEYPDGSTETVWLPDPNIKYFQGKHITLLILTILAMLAGVIFTILLFSWQWLLYYQDKKIFMWVRCQKLRLFLEPYHAPYTSKHRYWTGLLLLLRIILYLVISIMNMSSQSNPLISFLVIGVAMVSLLMFKGFLVSRIYRKWPIEVLEMTCHFNLAVFCLLKLSFIEYRKSDIIISYISGTITLVLLLIVLIYHFFTEIIFKISTLNRWWQGMTKTRKQNHSENLINQESDDKIGLPIYPTSSVVDGPTLACDEESIDEERVLDRKEIAESSFTDSSIPYKLIR